MIYLYIHNQANPEEVKWMFDKYISFLNFLKSVGIIQTNTTLDKPQKVITYFKNNDEYINLTSHGDFLVYKQETESSSANKIMCKLDKQCESLVYEAIRNNTEIPWAQRSQSIKEYCVKCEQFKDSHHFNTLPNGKKRDTCYNCRNNQERKREEKRIENNETRICRSCKIEKTIQGNFDRGSHLCFSCDYQKDVETHKNIKPPDTKQCSECNEEKDINDFPLSKDKKDLRKTHCKTCFNKQSYDTPTKILKHILHTCIRKQIPFITEQWNDLLKHIEPNTCYYCGYKPENGYLGLNRINLHGAFCIENCVQSCHVCSIMRGTQNVKNFIQDMITISVYYGKETISTLEKPPESISTNSHKDNQKNKDDNLTQSDYTKLNNTKICYLCGKSIKNTYSIDRINSNLGYQSDNVAATHIICNVYKKDYTIEEFVGHAHQIYDKNRLLF